MLRMCLGLQRVLSELLRPSFFNSYNKVECNVVFSLYLYNSLYMEKRLWRSAAIAEGK